MIKSCHFNAFFLERANSFLRIRIYWIAAANSIGMYNSVQSDPRCDEGTVHSMEPETVTVSTEEHIQEDDSNVCLST